MNIKLSEIRKSMYHLKFSNQYEITSTFMRLQEFYESPIKSINGRFFTLEKYMDENAKYYGNYFYNTAFEGFNVPDEAIRDFFDIFSHDLLEKEKNLKKILSKILHKKDKFYLIATYNNWAFEHEVAHGYYYLNPEYKEKMDNLVNNCKCKNKVFIGLDEVGYCEKVYVDEAQAYLATSTPVFLRDMFRYKKGQKDHIPFRKVFREFKNT